MTKVHPKISVVIPSFNQGEFIEETFVSLINQNYDNLEIIVIDGASTDHTVSIIKKYVGSIAYWVSEKDSGQSEAINKGFNRATGDIITWLNSDDYYEPGTLYKVANEFELDKDLSILHGKSRLFGKAIKQKVIGLDHDIALNDYFSYMRFPQPSSFFSREVLMKVLPVNNALHYAMDFELIVTMLLNRSKIKRTSEIFSGYRIHPSSKSNNHLSFLKEWSLVVGNFFNSVSGGDKYWEILIQLGLIKNNVGIIYSNSLKFSDKELAMVLLQHLNVCYHYNYRDFNRKQCDLISNYLRVNFYSFYKSNYYAKYNNRLTFIPKFLFRFMRANFQ